MEENQEQLKNLTPELWKEFINSHQFPMDDVVMQGQSMKVIIMGLEHFTKALRNFFIYRRQLLDELSEKEKADEISDNSGNKS